MEVLAGVVEVSELDDELYECLGVELAFAILHVIFKGDEAYPCSFGAGCEVVANAGEKLAVGLDDACQFPITLDAFLSVH